MYYARDRMWSEFERSETLLVSLCVHSLKMSAALIVQNRLYVAPFFLTNKRQCLNRYHARFREEVLTSSSQMFIFSSTTNLH